MSKKQTQAWILAVVLYATPPKRASAEEWVDFKVMSYQELDGRIGVTSPSFLYLYDVSPTFGIRIDGIFNAISGATPTGAPPEPIYAPRTVVIPGGGGGSYYDDDEFEDEREDEREGADDAIAHPRYHTMAAATPSGSSSTTLTELVPTGEFEIPMSEVEDERWGLNIELIKKVDNHALSSKISFSTESDYQSYALALSDGIDFNNRNTILQLGGAFTYDTIDVFSTGETDTKVSTDLMVGLTQLLSSKTRVQANLTLGQIRGYLNDTYKVAEVDGVLVPESRPDERNKSILYLSAIQYLGLLHASLEGSYRLYVDDHGITGHTAGLAWYQELTRYLILRPRARYYMQSAADYYGIRFAGAPQHYSSDYRISELDTLSYGLKIIVSPFEWLSVDVGYDRYEMRGLDGVTSPELYPSSDVYTGGIRLWF